MAEKQTQSDATGYDVPISHYFSALPSYFIAPWGKEGRQDMNSLKGSQPSYKLIQAIEEWSLPMKVPTQGLCSPKTPVFVPISSPPESDLLPTYKKYILL